MGFKKNRLITKVILSILLALILLNLLPAPSLIGEVELRPSRYWGMFFDSTGDVNITITDPGVAVKVEVPRWFLPGVVENDTSFIRSDISYDYYYYIVVDQSAYYPYDENAPYTIEIWNPPQYFTPECLGVNYNFTPPKYILLEDLTAPDIAGIYNFTVYIAQSFGPDNRPIYPEDPSKVVQVPVSMREDPSFIYGYIVDELNRKYIQAKGVVYAIEVNTGATGRGFVDPSTGFFNITGLYAGEYRLEGSAGYYPETGYAYAITESPSTYIVAKNVNLNIYNFSLRQGCIIDGSITYVDLYNNAINPLDSPYLNKLNFQDLNYTVEAYDEQEQIAASQIYASENVPTEEYTLILRNGTKHVYYPAYGTEYAGFGPGEYTIKIWVHGFTLPEDQVKTANLATGLYGNSVNVGESRLPYGGVVTGTIRLVNAVIEETPREAETKTFKSSTGKLFGGNILAEIYSQDTGSIKGLVIYNRTNADGTIQYADYSSGAQTTLLKFYVLGFSELHNQTYSGHWIIGSYPGPSPWDYGLEEGQYLLRIRIRGYIQLDEERFTLGEGGNATVIVDMQRGGATQITVESYTSKPGTRIKQSPTTWRFREYLCPPPYLRVYFYNSLNVEVGYTEGILRESSFVTDTTITLNFTGHNWPLFKTIIYGHLPSALDTDTYSVEAYTYGYIQADEVSLYIPVGQFSPISFPLLLGCAINGTVPLMMNNLFVTLTENTDIRPQALSEDIQGEVVVNATLGSGIFRFSNYGFYGKGHFFYVDPDGVRWKDYGLDVGNYSVFVPLFGYDRMFYQPSEIKVTLPDLGFIAGVYYHMERMVKLFGKVSGYTYLDETIPLVWPSIYHLNAYPTYTFDGDYAVHLQEQRFTVIYSVPGYVSQTVTLSTTDSIEYSPVLEQAEIPFSGSVRIR